MLYNNIPSTAPRLARENLLLGATQSIYNTLQPPLNIYDISHSIHTQCVLFGRFVVVVVVLSPPRAPGRRCSGRRRQRQVFRVWRNRNFPEPHTIFSSAWPHRLCISAWMSENGPSRDWAAQSELSSECRMGGFVGWVRRWFSFILMTILIARIKFAIPCSMHCLLIGVQSIEFQCRKHALAIDVESQSKLYAVCA